MTNFEKYKEDIMKIDGSIAFDKTTRKVIECCNVSKCENCEFNENCYESVKIKWFYKEYVPQVLTDNGIDLINTLSKINEKKYKYITRNGNRVFLFFDKPPIDKYGVRFTSGCNYLIITENNNTKNLFLNIKFEYGLYDIENKCFIKE